MRYVLPHYKTVAALVLLITIAVTGFAQVNRDEMENLPPVTFINYEGPHAVVDTREQIRQIGVTIGQQIYEREGALAPTLNAMTLEQRRAYTYRYEIGAPSRYYIIHSVSGPEGEKLDADIMGLGVDTGVDHIRNLRVIIQGYLQSAYNYSPSDALLLAQFITVYNAVYRGNWDYFTGRFKTPVIGNLVRERAGLSIRYDEWPGRTMMLIPLGQGIAAIDTGVISDSRVIEEMRREDDQGIPQRQQMVNLMEREAEQAERQAQTERQTARQEERQIAAERQQVEQQRQQTDEQVQSGRITQEEAAQVEQELNRREEDLDRRQAAVEERREEAQNLEDFAAQRREEAQEQRQEIAEDMQAAIAQESGGVYGVSIEKESPPMGRIIRYNTQTGREIRRSPMNTIHVRTVTLIDNRMIAVAGENVGQGAVRLVEVNQNNLEMARQGDDDIMPGSLLWVNGSDLYAITTDLSNNRCYIGRFNTNFILQAKSAVTVHPQGSVLIQQDRLLTQREDGSILILNPMDLTEIRF